MRKTVGSLVTSLALVGLLSSCGGGGGSASSPGSSGGGGLATPLTVAEKVSVVDAQVGGGSSSPARGAVRAPSFPADSDYVTDKTNVYVEEQSVQSFNSVNEILCMVAQTRYEAMLNAGPYKAQIDRNQCKGKGDASVGAQQSVNQSSGANMPDYATWTVDVTRTDNTAPQVVKVWAHEPAGDHEPEKVIYAKAVVTEGVSASNPYGLFAINFDGHPIVDGAASPQSMFKGTLRTELTGGKVLLKFFQNQNFDGNTSTEAATLDRNADGSSGGGTLRSVQPSPSGPQTRTFDIAYNSANFHRVGNGKDICLSRTQFDESAWRYGVYDATGARIVRQSNFPVRLSRGGTNYFGSIGYYGSWFPNGISPNDGETVYKQTFGPGGGTETAYQVLVAGGKLKKHTRALLALGNIVNIPLDMNEFDPASGTGTQTRILWDGAQFLKTATMNQTSMTWQNLDPAVAIDMNNLRYPELNFWSQALGGSVQIKLQDCVHNDNATPFNPSDDSFACAADNATQVVSYAEVTVTPSDTVPATLQCFENCPDAANLGGPNPFLMSSGYQPVPPANAVPAATYTFDTASMLLKSGGTDVVASSLDGGFQWGLMSGPLFENTTENQNLLKCEWDNNTCAWQARSNLPSYYTWETGPNSWNRFIALHSGSTFLSFEPPLSLGYIHLAAGKYLNARFNLEYGGFGDLNGIPGKCVNLETGLDADCSQGGPGSPIRWVPEFTIPDGSTATDSGNATYYIKALEKEQRMRKDLDACGALAVTSYASQLPGASDWVDPAVGTEPAVTGAPAVIGGVLQ